MTWKDRKDERKKDRDRRQDRRRERRTERRQKVFQFLSDIGDLAKGTFDAFLSVAEFGLDVYGTLFDIAMDPMHAGETLKRNKEELMKGMVNVLGVGNDLLGALTGEDPAADLAMLAELLGLDDTEIGQFLQDVSDSGLPFDTTLLNMAGAAKGIAKKGAKKAIKTVKNNNKKTEPTIKDRSALTSNTTSKDKPVEKPPERRPGSKSKQDEPGQKKNKDVKKAKKDRNIDLSMPIPVTLQNSTHTTRHTPKDPIKDIYNTCRDREKRLIVRWKEARTRFLNKATSHGCKGVKCILPKLK